MTSPNSANVRALTALYDMRLALISFQERAAAAMGELRTRIDRTLAWLEQDRPLYWKEQERRAYDGLASARVAFETCRLRTVAGRHPECIEEKKAFERAKRRLEFCQHQVEAVRRWNGEASRQADDYRGRSGGLSRQLDEEIPNAIAMVTRMIDAIEAYAETTTRSEGVSPVQLTPVEMGTKSEESASGNSLKFTQEHSDGDGQPD